MCVPASITKGSHHTQKGRFHGALAEQGAELMPRGSYGFSARFGWVNDRFGVSWQLNLPE
ncbi:VOC family protein [Streptomyces sp. ISL-94]|uniref:VOC family protein n=1 Tax=Streptomyces sp. ISL-94 TaxID=2819190 RepID=UPI001BE9B10F|nr:VOC family protein [Streptomyces sp. ISL-94]MBT2482403.1 VOC family protein [Streptomyces sp. ISL-94]